MFSVEFPHENLHTVPGSYSGINLKPTLVAQSLLGLLYQSCFSDVLAHLITRRRFYLPLKNFIATGDLLSFSL